MSNDQTEKVCPYSSVNQEFFDDQALGVATTTTASSCILDRYTKLDPPSYPSQQQQQQQQQQSGPHGRHSQSMFNLSSIPSGSLGNHKERISQIKQDLEQFSCHHQDHHGNKVAMDTGRAQPQSGGSGSTNSDNNMKSIPKISSRWSQFMCEADSDSDEDSSLMLTSRSLEEKSPGHSVHILVSKSTISKFTLVEDL